MTDVRRRPPKNLPQNNSGYGHASLCYLNFYCWLKAQSTEVTPNSTAEEPLPTTWRSGRIRNPRSGWSPDLFPAKKVCWQRSRVLEVKPAAGGEKKKPLRGDVFGIYFPDKKRIAHVGFVDSWEDKYVITVEGNTNEAGSGEGDGVYRKRRLIGSIYQVSRQDSLQTSSQMASLDWKIDSLHSAGRVFTYTDSSGAQFEVEIVPSGSFSFSAQNGFSGSASLVRFRGKSQTSIKAVDSSSEKMQTRSSGALKQQVKVKTETTQKQRAKTGNNSRWWLLTLLAACLLVFVVIKKMNPVSKE